MQIKWSVLSSRLVFWRKWIRLFLGDDDGRSGWSRGALSLTLPDVVHAWRCSIRLIWVADNPSRSCSRPTFNIEFWLRLRANCPRALGQFSSQRRNRTGSLHYICILTWETFQIKKHHSRSNRVSFFALQHLWHCSLAFRRLNASEKCHVYSNGKKARRDLNASDAVFLPFPDGENHLSIGSMVQRYKSDSEKRPGRSGRSLGRSWIVLVGWIAKLIKIIIFGRNSFVLWPRLNVRN